MPLGFGNEDLNAVEEAEKAFGAVAVTDQRIEGREHADAGGWFRGIHERGDPVGKGEGGARFAVHGLDQHIVQLVAMGCDPGLRLLRCHDIEEGGDFARGGKAEPAERRAAGPVDEGLVVDLRGMMLGGNDPLGEVIDLLEPLAAGDRQLARVPEKLERGLGGMPVPPAAGLVALGLHVARHDRAMLADAGIGLLE